MTEKLQIGLNRMVAPGMGLQDFIDLSGRAGAVGIELRNDLPGKDLTDGLDGDRLGELLAAQGLVVLSINAVQHFNLPEAHADARKELQRLIATGRRLGGPPIVLCPHNDTSDTRDDRAKRKDTETALRELVPILEDAGVTGLVEPLGFPESSLRSPLVAAEIISAIDSSSLQLLIDTFHFAVAGMDQALLGTDIPVAQIGLVHLSGVAADGPVSAFRDPDRVYIDGADRVENCRTVQKLLDGGYQGVFSYEPFSPAVHGYTDEEILRAVRESTASLKDRP